MLLRASEQKTPSLYQFSAIGPISDLIYQPISRRVFVYIDSLFRRRLRSRRFDDETIGPVTPITMLGIQTFA
jgi:hypothetical protein